MGRFDRAVRWRANEQVAQQTGQLAELEARVNELRSRCDEIGADASWGANELRRLAPQLASLEVRVGRLEERVNDGGDGSISDVGEEELREARSLVEHIRAEHERIRVRLTAIARYEERIERIESLSLQP